MNLTHLRSFISATAFACLAACSPSPSKVVAEFDAAITAGNLDAAMNMVADNVEVTDPTGAKVNGKADTRAMFDAWAQKHGTCELVGTRQTEGNKVTWMGKVASDDLTKLGVAPLEVSHEAMIDQGKIVSMTMMFTPEASTKMQTAMNEQTKKVYMDFHTAMNAANLDAAVAAFSEAGALNILPDHTFTGAEQLRAHFTETFAQHPQFEIVGTPEVAGNKVTITANVTRDDWKKLNIAPLQMRAEATIANEKITSMTVAMTPESAEKFTQAMASAQPAASSAAKAATKPAKKK